MGSGGVGPVVGVQLKARLVHRVEEAFEAVLIPKFAV